MCSAINDPKVRTSVRNVTQTATDLLLEAVEGGRLDCGGGRAYGAQIDRLHMGSPGSAVPGGTSGCEAQMGSSGRPGRDA